MDYQKFIQELPEVYESWKQESNHPKSEQFQKVIDRVQETTTAGILQLLNFAVSCLESDEIYCEVGTKKGATLIGALLNHANRFAYAIGNYSEADNNEIKLQTLTTNIAQFALLDQIVFCNQEFEDFFLEFREIEIDSKIGLYFYNGSDDYRSQLLSLLLVKSFLAERALIVIGNHSETAEQAIWDFIATNCECRFLADVGIYILAWDIHLNNSKIYDSVHLTLKRNQFIIQAIKGVIDPSKIWERINLGWHLKSGLIVQVKSLAEWVIYNDIFVDGEYDFPILATLNSASDSSSLQILDLGANVGFFTWRIADLFAKNKKNKLSLKITLVEGSPTVYTELSSRIAKAKSQWNSHEVEFRCFHGLIGDRQGIGTIFESDFHGMNSIMPKEEDRELSVPFLDLALLYKTSDSIDLLKCDIEGSELIFLNNYRDFITKVKSAVFEFHPTYCDINQCFEILKEAGFAHHKVLREELTFSVHFFWK